MAFFFLHSQHPHSPRSAQPKATAVYKASEKGRKALLRGQIPHSGCFRRNPDNIIVSRTASFAHLVILISLRGLLPPPLPST